MIVMVMGVDDLGYGGNAVTTQPLAQLYAASRLYINFQPSFKVKSKARDGARVAELRPTASHLDPRADPGSAVSIAI